jgi:hypothetical protein
MKLDASNEFMLCAILPTSFNVGRMNNFLLAVEDQPIEVEIINHSFCMYLVSLASRHERMSSSLWVKEGKGMHLRISRPFIIKEGRITAMGFLRNCGLLIVVVAILIGSTLPIMKNNRILKVILVVSFPSFLCIHP